MNVSSAAAVGMVESLRGVTTTERLRSDHIMTLELMKETMDENASLKDINKKLLAKLTRLGDDGIINDDASNNQATHSEKMEADSSALTKRLLKQEEELGSLRNENKLLKGQAKQDQRRIKELQRSNNSNDALRRELDMLKVETSKVAETPDARDDSTVLKAQVQELTEKLQVAAEQLGEHVPGCVHRITELEASLQIATDHTSNSVLDYEQKLQQAHERTAALETQVNTLLEQEKDAISKCTLLETKYRELKKLSDISERALKDRLHEAGLRIEASEAATEKTKAHLEEKEYTIRELQGINTNLEKRVAELLARSKVQSNPLLLQPDSDDSAFFLTDSVEVNPAPKPADESFDEFVRLRKEVKSLKLQLLELSQSKSNKTRGSAASSTVFNPR